jgi:general secretion pathway protein I
VVRDAVPGALVMRAWRRRGPRRQRGFSLLEAIVAMVLISSMGGALFAWINTELQALERTQDANTRAEAMVNAVEFMEAVNPMLTPQGKAPFASLELAWEAKASTPVRDGVSYPQGISLYQLAMYDTQVRVAHPDGSPWFEFTLQQVGYKRVRDNKPF